MNKLLIASILSFWSGLFGVFSQEFGDPIYPYHTWFIAFSLPIWSILSTGLWYDIGRTLFGGNVVELDSKNSRCPSWIRSAVYTIWMSLMFTYISWVHIALQAIPLLLIIPLLAIPLNHWLTKSWDDFRVDNIDYKTQLISTIFWAFFCYPVYWILSISWILIKVWFIN